MLTWQVYHFKQMLRSAGHLERVQPLKVSDARVEPYMPEYKRALAKLSSVYSQQRLS